MDADPIAVMITTTAATKTLLESIAQTLVQQRLAACCQISGLVDSIYRWDGNVDKSDEFVCTIKTVPALVEQVIATIGDLHSYDEPEIIVTPIIGGSESYLRWIVESVGPQAKDR